MELQAASPALAPSPVDRHPLAAARRRALAPARHQALATARSRAPAPASGPRSARERRLHSLPQTGQPVPALRTPRRSERAPPGRENMRKQAGSSVGGIRSWRTGGAGGGPVPRGRDLAPMGAATSGESNRSSGDRIVAIVSAAGGGGESGGKSCPKGTMVRGRRRNRREPAADRLLFKRQRRPRQRTSSRDAALLRNAEADYGVSVRSRGCFAERRRGGGP
jgi:hypothetical protein